MAQMDGQPDSEAVKGKKAYMRKQMLKRRAGLGKDYCQDSDRAILERLLGMKIYRQAEVIFVYVSMEGEVDTRQLIFHALADGKKVAVPRCEAKGIMKAYSIRGMQELVPGAYGIPEPVKACGEVKPEDMELAVMPCVCCSQRGLRLGYGGGYYDRYLAKCPAVRTALCRERMMVEHIPAEGHDCLMDFVVTEERVLDLCRQ